MSKQTAVQWILERVQKLVDWQESHYKAPEYTVTQLSNDFEEALAMEREQIEEAYKAALPLDDNPDYMSNKYYTQTFKPVLA